MILNTFPVETQIPLERETRLYSPIRNICIAIDAFSFATRAFHSEAITVDPKFPTRMDGMLADAKIVLPHGSTLAAALRDEPHAPLWILFTTPDTDHLMGGRGGPMSQMVEYFHSTATAQYVLYYEAYWDWVNAKAFCDVKRLGPVWGFARVVRNAIVHGGTINIEDQAFRPVEWMGITYGAAQFRRAISDDLKLPDLILLMIAMDLELDVLGPTSEQPS